MRSIIASAALAAGLALGPSPVSAQTPFVLLMLAFTGLLVAWPQMALWLPQKLF